MTQPPTITAPRKSVLIVRHGESEWNKKGLLAGWSDTPLTDFGREQARALRPFLQDKSFDSVWSSPLSRAQETARLAWEKPFQTDERIKEFHFGENEGVALKTLAPDYVALLQDFENFQPKGGELGRDFFLRIDQFFLELPQGSHLVFAHGGIIRRLFHHVGIRKFPSNASMYLFDLKGPALIEEILNPLSEPRRNRPTP